MTSINSKFKIQNSKLPTRWVLIVSALLLALPAQAQDRSFPEKGFVVNDYSYDPAGSGGDPDIGLSLCATRCNALSMDYVDYLMSAGGWELHKQPGERTLTVPLDNPFLQGNCICTADEYLIKINDRNLPKPPTGAKP